MGRSQLDRSYKGQKHEPHGEQGGWLTPVGFQSNQKRANLGRGKRLMMTDLLPHDGATQRGGGVVLGPQCRNGVPENRRGPLPDQEGKGARPASFDLLEDFENVRSRYRRDRKRADGWKNVSFQNMGKLTGIALRPT